MASIYNFKQPTYKDVPFYCEETSNEFGGRLVSHQFPQHNTPYVENMGRKGRIFTITAYVIGDRWEQERDDLIKVCEDPSPGILSHPDFGEFKCEVDSCTVTESKQNAARRATFQITFWETGKNPFTSEPTTLIQDNSAYNTDLNYLTISNIFAEIFNIWGAAAYWYDSIKHTINSLLIDDDLAASADTYVAYTQLQGNDLSRAYTMPVDISNYIASIGGGTKCVMANTPVAVGGGKFTKPIYKAIKIPVTPTPKLVVDRMLHICNKPLPITPSKYRTPAAIHAEKMVGHTNTCIKTFCAVEAINASTSINFVSIHEARVMWDDINSVLIDLHKFASDNEDYLTATEIKSIQIKFQKDILARTPSLTKVIHKNIKVTPSLVLAYQQYDNALKDLEIVSRNHIQHPAFIAGEVELLA